MTDRPTDVGGLHHDRVVVEVAALPDAPIAPTTLWIRVHDTSEADALHPLLGSATVTGWDGTATAVPVGLIAGPAPRGRELSVVAHAGAGPDIAPGDRMSTSDAPVRAGQARVHLERI